MRILSGNAAALVDSHGTARKAPPGPSALQAVQPSDGTAKMDAADLYDGYIHLNVPFAGMQALPTVLRRA